MRKSGIWLLVLALMAIVQFAVGLEPLAAGASSRTQFPWKGHDATCSVRLPTPGYVTYGQFTTCPPKRVLVIGDSLALTMGIEMSIGQEDWGTIMDGKAINGCGFVTGTDLEHNGTFVRENPACDNELATWTTDIHLFKPQAILIEMGWWDSFQHMINGTVQSLADPSYDNLVEQQIVHLTQGLRSATSANIYLLSVPWMNPAPLPNGQPEPAASPTSHNEINSLLQAAAASSSATHVVDVSPYITPSGHFQTNVDGKVCRSSDGIHLYYAPNSSSLHYVHTPCGQALQRGVLSMIRQGLSKT